MTTSAHRLRLNDLVLSSGDGKAVSDNGAWWLEVYADEFVLGKPEPIEATMRTLLQDGARVMTQGYGNREVSFLVVVGGNDSVALADGELALASNLGRRAELGWTPPDGWAAESVFDVETSSMEQGGPDADEDLLELKQNSRVYRLRFVCQPFARTATEVVVPSVFTPDVPLDEVTLNLGTSTPGWTAPGGTLTDMGAFLRVSGTTSPRAVWTPASPVDISTRPYLTISVYGVIPYLKVNGVVAELVGSSSVSDFTGTSAQRFYFATDQTSITNVEFGGSFGPGNTMQFKVLRARNLPLLSATPKQSVRSIDVQGSARTQGSVQIAADEGEGLGSVVFYTSTAKTPNIVSLRSHRTAGLNTPSTDATAVTGLTEFISGDLTFEVPISELNPGKHQLLGRIYKAGSGALEAVITWTAQVVVNGTPVGPIVPGSVTQILGANSRTVMSLGTTNLPTTDLPDNTTAVVRFEMEGSYTGDPSSPRYDEIWLLNLDEGAVTVVEAGTHQRAWIETATTARPRPAIYVGDAEDQSDAFCDPAQIKAWGVHEFSPGAVMALVVASDVTTQPDVSFRYYPRSLNFVAKDAS